MTNSFDDVGKICWTPGGEGGPTVDGPGGGGWEETTDIVVCGEGFIPQLIRPQYDWKPNVYCGGPLTYEVVPERDNGTTNYTRPDVYFNGGNTDEGGLAGFITANRIEAWIKFHKFSSLNTGSNLMGIGAFAVSAGDTLGDASTFLHFGLEIVNTGIRPYTEGTDGALPGATVAPPTGWHYYVVTSNQVDTMLFYIDGVLQSTTSIEGYGAVATLALHTYNVPLGHMTATTASIGDVDGWDVAASTDPGGSFPDSLTDPFTTYAHLSMPCMVGPVAMHRGTVFTTAVMKAAMNRRGVTSGSGLSGAQNYATPYYWQDILFDIGNRRRTTDVDIPFEPTLGPRWDFNPRHSYRGITDYPSMVGPVGIPVGLDGNVGVPPRSPFIGATILPTTNNLGHFTPSTSTRYGQKNDTTNTNTGGNKDYLRCTEAADITAAGGDVNIGAVTPQWLDTRGLHAFSSDPFFAGSGEIQPL